MASNENPEITESEQDTLKTDGGPEHTAPVNPNYSSSFDESAGGPDAPLKRD